MLLALKTRYVPTLFAEAAMPILPQREIFKIVKAMGGTHSTDFTDLTTHLIAEETGSEKYTASDVFRSFLY